MSPHAPKPTAARAGAHAGQSLVEYLLIIGVIAVLCLPAFAFLQGATRGAFDRQSAGLNAPPIGTTTAAAPVYTSPANDEACKQGLWATYVTPEGTFKNQGDCQSWVATNGRNAPALTPTP